MKKYFLLLAVFILGCANDIDTAEQAFNEAQKLLTQYRVALASDNAKEAEKLRDTVVDLQRKWGRGVSGCSEGELRFNAYTLLLDAAKMELVIAKKDRLTPTEIEKALEDYHSATKHPWQRPDQLERMIESCKQARRGLTPESVTALHAAFQPILEIDKAARMHFSPEMWKHAADADAARNAYYIQRSQNKQAATKEVSDCVAAATIDSRAASQVRPEEILASCKTMLR